MRLEAGKKSRKFSFVNFAAYIVNVAIVFATIMAYLSTVTNPSVFTFPAFFGLIFPLLALANLLFVIWWMIKRKKAFLLSFFTLILVSGLLGRTFVKNEKCNVQTPDFVMCKLRILACYLTIRDFLMFISGTIPCIPMLKFAK